MGKFWFVIELTLCFFALEILFSTTAMWVQLVARLWNSNSMISEFDHINCLDIISFRCCAFVHEQYYIKTVYISCVHPVFSSQKHILLFGISFHLAYVLITHSFSSPKCRLALQPNRNSYSKGYYDFFPQGVKQPGHEVDHTPPPSAKTE